MPTAQPPADIHEALSALARRHLPAGDAERWIALLRPAARLLPAGPPGGSPAAASPGEPVVGRLGGLPRLPAGAPWPVWEGHGPLSPLAALDCAALPAARLDIPLPDAGTLLFFVFRGEDDDPVGEIDFADPATRGGAQIRYVPAGTATAERAAPPGAAPWPAVPLTARVEPTAGDPTAPPLHRAFAPRDAPVGVPYDHPVCDLDFVLALDSLHAGDRPAGPRHQLGGHGRPVVSATELWAAHDALGLAWDDPRLLPAAEEWVLLAQFDSDPRAGMEWGDGGAVYWTVRRADLAAGRFDRAMFTWQSG